MSGTVYNSIWQSLPEDSPCDSLTFYTSSHLDLRVAFFSGGELRDMSDADHCVFMLKWGSNPAGSPLLYRRVEVNAELTQEQWEARSSQHASFVFSSSETGIDLGGLREARLVASWVLVSPEGEVVSVVSHPVFARVSGVEVAVPMSGFYTKAEADARFMRQLTEQFVVENFNHLNNLDATDPAVKDVADVLCTFIQSLQAGGQPIPGDFDVENFAEQLNLDGSNYTLQQLKDLLCTLITQLKSKGVV